MYVDRFVMNNLDNVSEYNFLEEILGFTLFDEVFKYYLKATGYNIICNYECMPALHSKTEKDESQIPDSYITDYINLRNYSKDQIQETETRQRLHKATTKDKTVKHSFFFYKNYIDGKIDLADEELTKYYTILQERAAVLDLSIPEQIECEMFNQSKADKNIERILSNLNIEQNTKKINGRNKVTKEQEQLVMLEYIKTALDIRGLESSTDTVKVIGDIEMEKFRKWYKDTLTNVDRTVLLKLFCIRVKTSEFDIKQAQTVVSGMFYRWSGMKLLIVSSRRTRPIVDNVKTSITEVSCRLNCELNKSVVCYWLGLKLMQDKTKRELENICVDYS